VISTTLSNEGTILIIEVKITGQLLRRWFANIATIALLLCLSQVLVNDLKSERVFPSQWTFCPEE